MKIFGRVREVLRVERAKASRAVYQDADTQRIEITLDTEGNGRLTLELSVDVAHDLILQMSNSYDAIRPPLSRGTGAAGWQGMDN